MTKTIVFIGGTFDDNKGKSSKVVQKIYEGFVDSGLFNQYSYFHMNGGHTHDIAMAKDQAVNAKVVVWMPHVDNQLPKESVNTIKALNPHCVLVTSKRSIETLCTPAQIVQHGLKKHSNLMVVFAKESNLSDNLYICMELVDPLGNSFTHTFDAYKLGQVLAERAYYLVGLTRLSSSPSSLPLPEPPDEPVFLEQVKKAADAFAKLIITSEPTERFLGNAAFRCTFGFPAVKYKEVVYVSRRNVDKTTLTMQDFVPIDYGVLDKVVFSGRYKPSVDAPIQMRLFRLYPHIKYIMHGHVYVHTPLGIPATPMTHNVVPCGALVEVNEIWDKFPDMELKSFVINLRGHGFMAASDNPEFFETLLPRYRARPAFESQTTK